AGRTKADGLAVIGERHVEQDDRTAGAYGAGVQLLETVDDEEIRLDPLGRRRDASAQTEHHDRMSCRVDDLCALFSADPSGHGDDLSMHVLEAIVLHFLDGPLNRAIELRRAAQAVADRVGQLAESAPRAGVAERLAD